MDETEIIEINPQDVAAKAHDATGKSGRKRRSKSSRKQTTRHASGQSREDETNIPDQDKKEFVSGVLTRGEAAPPDQKDLMPGQTHRVVKKDDSGETEIKRERFSAF